MTDTNYLNFDFGFTTVDEDELEAVIAATTQVEELASTSSELTADFEETKKKLDTMYQMIQPLLMNLAQDPEKEYILWPDRVQKVQQFKELVDQLYMS